MADAIDRAGEGAAALEFVLGLVGVARRSTVELPLEEAVVAVGQALVAGPAEAVRVCVEGLAVAEVGGAPPRRDAEVSLTLVGRAGEVGSMEVWTREPAGAALQDAIAAAGRMIADAAAIDDLQQQARAAGDARDHVLAVASHELRAPIAAIKLALDAGLRRVRSTADVVAPEWVAGRLEPMQRQVDHLTLLVERLLDASQGREITLELVEVDLVEVVREVVARMHRDLEWARCPCTVTAPPSLVGRWDRLRLEQVLVNLLTNAIKYGRRRPIAVEVAGTPTHARLAVRDHGVGIAADDVPRLFQRYERLSPPPDVPGLGLGLWICGQIVAALGGRIAVTSAPMQGACFTVELPRSPAATQNFSRSQGAPAGG